MNIKIKIINFLVIIFTFFSASCATLSKESEYHVILKEIKAGDIDFSFVRLKNFLKEHPDSIYKPEIKFAICEYYFQVKDYHDAIEELTAYILDYPNGKRAVFAKAILYKILLDYRDEPMLLGKLKDNFFFTPVFFIFSDTKIKYYRSILNNDYKITEYVNKIEVFRNNELFFEVTP